MLTLGLHLLNKPVMSLRTGSPVGQATEALINPNSLKVEGWFATDVFNRSQCIVLSQDIRDIVAQGFVVNDHEALTLPSELVRLKSVLDLKFDLVGKPVITQDKKKLGKVTDYAFDKDGFVIQKLYVGQSVFNSFSGGSVIVDRSQIVEITNSRIVVKEATVPGRVEAVSPVVAPEVSPA